MERGRNQEIEENSREERKKEMEGGEITEQGEKKEGVGEM